MTPQMVRQALAQVNGLIAQAEAGADYPGRERWLLHLRGRRDVLETELERAEARERGRCQYGG